MPRPRPEKALIDTLYRLVRLTLGADEQPLEVRVTFRPFKLTVVTDHGGRITIDSEPTAN